VQSGLWFTRQALGAGRAFIHSTSSPDCAQTKTQNKTFLIKFSFFFGAESAERAKKFMFVNENSRFAHVMMFSAEQPRLHAIQVCRPRKRDKKLLLALQLEYS
jgi:hypothetical protein